MSPTGQRMRCFFLIVFLFADDQNVAEISRMTSYFNLYFNYVRHDCFLNNKEMTRGNIFSFFQQFGLQTSYQEFESSDSILCKTNKSYETKSLKGKNVIGILPGKFRGEKGQDKIVVIGAHYDTKRESPGVEDNGSGCVALLELARIVSSCPRLNYTVIFVAFDHEEIKLTGSKNFVQKYLIPTELISREAKFLGAFIMDMVMNYDSNNASQLINEFMEYPVIQRQILEGGLKGDFLGVYSRPVDDHLFAQIEKHWTRQGKYQLRNFQIKQETSSNKLRSDHASFWNHGHPNYTGHLPAVLIDDTGKQRGKSRKCYHKLCDSTENFLNEANLNFLKNTIDVMKNVICTLSTEDNKNPSEITQKPNRATIGMKDPSWMILAAFVFIFSFSHFSFSLPFFDVTQVGPSEIQSVTIERGVFIHRVAIAQGVGQNGDAQEEGSQIGQESMVPVGSLTASPASPGERI